MKWIPAFAAFAAAAGAHAQIILTEVMYNPRGSENANEFVEVHNLSAEDTVSLAGWKIGDQNALDLIISPQSSLALAPQHYALILDPNYFSSSTQYEALIPPSALILTLADNTFGSAGFSNSAAETVILIDAHGDTVAKYTYSPGNGDGISDEKIELVEDDRAANWADALRVDGTPGFANSVLPRQIDGELLPASLRVAPLPLRADAPAAISVVVRNAGRNAFGQFAIDFDLIPTGREFGAPLYLGSIAASRELPASDTMRLDFSASNLRPGTFRLVATLALERDGNAGNDTAAIDIAVGWQREAIVINEIMFDPGGGQPEWIEIYNPQNFGIPLGEWLIEDEGNSKSTPHPRLEIPPRRYRVLTASAEVARIFGLADTSVVLLDRFPALNNSGDAVLLRDFSGALIDSVAYEGDWGRAGKSLEKIWHERANSRRNWAPSRAARGATPAAFNSVSPRAYNLETGPLRIFPERPGFGESIRLEIPVYNRGRHAFPGFAVKILFDTAGARNWQTASTLRVLQNPSGLASEDSILLALAWDQPPAGSIDLAAIVQGSGDEFADDDSSFAAVNVSFAPRTVVINEVMYDPPAGQPDWIELFNPQARRISLAGCTVADETGNRVVIGLAAALPARSYRVLTSSSSLASQYHLPDSMFIVLPNLPAFNQAGDGIALRDPNGRTVDSLRYDGVWGASGRSIEKVWFERENSYSNWLPSRAMVGATPAAFNSVSPREYDLAVTAVQFLPARPRAGEQVHLTATIANKGRQTMSSFSVAFYAEAEALFNEGGRMGLGEVSVAQELEAEDSLQVGIIWPQPPSGRIRLMAEARETRDQIPENNLAFARLPVAYSPRSVIINEIYYAPAGGEIEWFEVFNRSAAAVDLGLWLWQDADAASAALLPDSGLCLQSGQYAVISPAGAIFNLNDEALHLLSSKWLPLNNDEEKLRIFDFNSTLQDSLRFNARWGGGAGVSLERINPHLATQDSGNWSSCVARSGSTPGRANSILTTALPSAAALHVSPNPFSPDEDGFDDFALFQIRLPVTAAAVHLKVFDLRGRLIRHLLNNQPVGSRYEIVWNGRDERNEPVRTGLYIVYMQALRADQGVLLEARAAVTVARPLN